MTRKAWTPAEDSYLISSNGRVSAQAQAQRLGRSLTSVYQRRELLRKTGRRPAVNPRWTPDQEAEMVALIESGLSTTTVARRIGRSPQAISCRLMELGTPIGELRRAGILRARSARDAARLLGVSAYRVMAWIARGDLAAARNNGRLVMAARARQLQARWQQMRKLGQRPRYSKQTAWHLISDQSIMDFLSDRTCWMLVDPTTITDPDWREFALEARKDAGGEWWDAARLAEYLIVSPKTAGAYIRRGDWPGAIKRYNEWYVWSAIVLAAEAKRRAA